MCFEYDLEKSITNKSKHGIDFEEAKALWEDPELLEVPARTIDEVRSLFVGKIADKHWSAVVTYREAKIRIISVRRSLAEEVQLYEKN